MTRLRSGIGLACVFAAISLPSSAASSLWSVGGPGGGSISVLAMDPQHATTIYAGTADGGIWKTTDATSHWTPALAGLPMFAGHPLPINAIAVDPTVASRAYAATNRGLFKTDDGGTSWAQTGASVLEGFLNVIGINPTSSSTVFVGTSNGIFVTTDAGANWSPSNTGLVDGQGQTPTVLSLLINPDVSSSMIAGTRDAGTFLSTDGGQSWKKFGGAALDGVDVTGLVVDPENIGSVYALSPELGVFRTAPPSNATVSAIVRDEGENDWESLLDDLFLDVFEEEICGGSPCFAEFLLLYFFSPTSAAAPAPFASGNPPEFMVGTSGLGIFHSIDGGATFTAINDGLPSFGVSAIAGVGSSSTRYAGFGGAGVAKTTDDAHWTTANNGLLASEVGAVAVAPSSPTIVYAVTGSSIFKSFDAGVSWQDLTSIGIDQQLFPALAVDPTNSSIVYAASDEKGVIKTSNGGSSWSASNTGISTTGVDSFAIVSTSPETVYAGTDSGIFKSTDGGAHWTLSNPDASLPTVRALAIDPANAQTMFAGTDEGIFRSTDGGVHWTDVSGGSDSFLEAQIHGIAIDPAAHTHVYLATENGVWKSTDGGSTWTEIDSAIPSTSGQPNSPAIVIEPGSKIDAAVVGVQIGPGNGVYRSTDGGATWTAIEPGLTNGNVAALAVSGGSSQILYAGTVGGGVFRSPAAPPPPPPGTRKIIPVHPAPPQKDRPRRTP